MASYTSTINGNWSNSATWGGAGVPGINDIATINTVVAVTGDVTIGDGVSSVLSVATTASRLNIQGAKLTIRGSSSFGAYNGGGVQIFLDISNSGSIPGGIEFYGSGGTRPTMGFGYDSMLRTSGTSAARNFIRVAQNSPGLSPVISGIIALDRELFVDSLYTDYSGLGDSGTFGMLAGPSLAVSLPPGYNFPPFKFNYCNFYNCGATPFVTADTNFGYPYSGMSDVEFNNCNWISGVGQFCCVINTDASAITSGTRQMFHCTFDQNSKPYLIAPRDFTINDNVFLYNFQTNGTSHVWASFKNNLVYKYLLEESAPLGSMVSVYWLKAPLDESQGTPVDCIMPHNDSVIVSGCRCEYIGTRDDLYWISPGEGTDVSTRTITMVNNVCDFRIGNGFYNPYDPAHTTYACEHNTIKVGSHGAIDNTCNNSNNVGGTNPPTEIANQITSFRSNICWSPVPGTGLYAAMNFSRDGNLTGVVVDALAAANADYNNLYNLNTVSGAPWASILGDTNVESGTSYNTPMTGAVKPGVHDIIGNPNFVDSTRGVVQFDSHMGGPGLLSNAINKLYAQYDPANINYVSGYNTAALLHWVLLGFQPQNQSLKTASYPADSSTMDALGNSWLGGSPAIGALNVLQSSVTSYTLKAPNPASGDVTVASQLFTVITSGTFAGTGIITPFASNSDGYFTPSTVSLTQASPTGTFTYTPSLWGMRSISTTSDIFTDPSPVNYLARIKVGKSGTSPTGNFTPSLGGYDLFSKGPWLPEFKRDISQDPVDPNSDTIMALFIGDPSIHIDFSATGSGLGFYGYGIPFNIVSGTWPTTLITTTLYTSQSDVDVSGHARVHLDTAGSFEGAPTTGELFQEPSNFDRHCLTIVRDEVTGGPYQIEELYQIWNVPESGSWFAHGYALFDMASGIPRIDGLSSVDAAGLAMTPLLLNYNELAAGSINHTLRATFPIGICCSDYCWPARHSVGANAIPTLPFGGRLRLKKSWYDIHASGYSGQALKLINTMLTYGVINADITGVGLIQGFFLDGVSDDRWDADTTTHGIFALQHIPMSAFEIPLIPSEWTVSYPASGPVNVPITVNITRNPITDLNFNSNIYYGVDGISLGAISLTPASLSGSFSYTPLTVGTHNISTAHGNNTWYPTSQNDGAGLFSSFNAYDTGVLPINTSTIILQFKYIGNSQMYGIEMNI